MSVASYKGELEQGLTDAIVKLGQIQGLVLYGFNICTDPDVGITEFSADTRSNSDLVVRAMQQWQQKTAKELRATGRDSWIEDVMRPYVRNTSPADFEYRGIVRIEHTDWESVMAGVANIWAFIEECLTQLRDEAAVLIGRSLDVEPDAEVSIGTRTDWYDLPIPVKRGS